MSVSLKGPKAHHGIPLLLSKRRVEYFDEIRNRHFSFILFYLVLQISPVILTRKRDIFLNLLNLIYAHASLLRAATFVPSKIRHVHLVTSSALS